MYIPDEQIKNMSLDQLIDLYRQGYSIRENIYPPIDSILPYSPRDKFKFMTMDGISADMGLAALLIVVAGIALSSFIYYNIGKAETRLVGLEK